MKGHKGRHHKATGGVNEAEQDLKSKPEERNNAKKEFHEAEERKHGGRAKRKHGGHVKHEMKVEGHHGKHHAGRKPRKHGGKTSGNIFAFTAHKGTPPKGHTDEMGM